MANVSNARGLIPVQHANGAPYNGAGRVYYVPANYGTALYVGDPVVLVTASGDANGIPTVAIGTGGSTTYHIGAVVSVITAGDPPIAVTRDVPVYHPASTAGYVFVADDPDLVFEIQEDGIGGAMGVAASSRNADLISGTGSTTSGYSGWLLDSSTLQTTSTLQMRILRPVQRADNDPTLTASKWLVKFNLHSFRNATGI